MSAELKVLKTDRTLQDESVTNTLKEAAEAGYEWFIIVGMDKRSTIVTLSSGLPSRCVALGALEFAKHDVLEKD